MYLNILLVQEQQEQQAEKQDGEIGLWAPLATQCCYCKFTTSLLSSPLRVLFASTHSCHENAKTCIKTSRLMDRAGLSASTAAHALLVLPWWLPQYCSFNCNSYLQYLILLYFIFPSGKKPQDASCNSASGKETAGMQEGGEEEADRRWAKFHLAAQCPDPAGVWTCQRWTWQEGWGGSKVLTRFSPAWPSSVSENKSFPSLWEWCKIPPSMVVSAHVKCISSLSAPLFIILQLTQSPGLEKVA